ncbi:MAG: ATP-binding protein [Nanoarchaeota archaeon]
MAIQRKLSKKLKEQAKNRKISILIGARQVGKTTILKELFENLSRKGNKCLFLDVDILSNYEKISSFDNLLNLLRLNGYDEKQKEFFYLFIDEFQKYPLLTKIMKNSYDNIPNVKIYASGSSSLTIKDQVQESLAGRKIINEMFPLDFEEFLIFKNKKRLAENLKNIQKLKGDNLSSSLREYRLLLEEYMIFGGYPEMALAGLKEEKIQVLSSIFDLYVKKDLVEHLNVDKILNVKRLVEFLAVNSGQKIKYEELSKVSSLSFNEVKKYIEILSETYIIREIRPFFTNKNKELVKIPKIYFLDNGVRNYFTNNFNELKLRDDSGFLFEGFILAELIKEGVGNIKFWNDKNLEEIDFIKEEGGLLTPIEIKFKEILKSSDFSGLNSFLKSYKKIKKAYLISLNCQKKEKKVSLILPYLAGKEIHK